MPIYFVVGPKAPFEIKAEKAGKPFDHETLINEAAKLGLDWLGFKAWFKKEKYHFYYGCLDEQGFRLCEELKPPRNGSAVLTGNTCFWSDFICTEGAVNLTSKTPPFKMRDLFEGEAWTNLEDVPKAGERYSMLVGICALVTTKDGYLILERRSSHVSSDPGKITSTANGGIQWSDMFPEFPRFHFFRVLGSWFFRTACPHKRSPAWAVLRELKEETGINIRRNCEVNRIFIGAGFDLVHGRDLNLYASLRCNLSLKQVSAHRARAKDRWELDHLIFVDPRYIGPHGTLTGPFKELDFDRQLRAALLCYDTVTRRQNHPSSSAT